MKKFYLGLKRGRYQKSIYPLEGSVTIGRSSENDITLVDHEVSHSHARMSFQKSSWVIEDLGSANGIIFSGEHVVNRALQSGDIFEIGGATLHFIEEDALGNLEQLSETMQMFAALINYQSPLIDPNNTNPGFMRLHGALLSNPIFRSLGKKELRGLEDIANLHIFGDDQLILQEGDPGRSIYIILYGRVKVFTKDYEGNEFQLATLVSNQFFGEMALLSGKPRSDSVATLEESLLGEISYNNMRSLMLHYPQIKKVLLEYFRKRAEDSKKKRAEASIQERRLQPRVNERLLVRFTVWPTETLPEEMINHTYKATSSEISPSGTLLVVMGPATEAFRPGCQLQLEIALPEAWGKVSTLGIIRHVDHCDHTAQLGINFSDTSAEDVKKLQNFLFGQTHATE
jgi:CRP-like cAMP-binding protein